MNSKLMTARLIWSHGGSRMRTRHLVLIISAVAVAIAACSSGGGPAGTTAPTQLAVATLVASAVPEATQAAATSASSEGTGTGGQPTAGTLDPCSLLTADEASTAVGVKLGAGVTTQLDPDVVCTWKKGTTEVKLILAPPAPDAATAQGYWDAERPQVPEGISVKDISGFDRAAYGTGGVSGYSVSALFVIQGTTFFDFYCGLKACSEKASVDAANLVVGRLPS